MKRTLIVISAGILAGLLGHAAWFAARRPQPPDGLEAQLNWIQARLELNAEQYEQIKRLHEQLRPQLATLAGEVERMRSQLAAYEHQRMTAGQIDFVEFARFLRQQRSIDDACEQSTRNLVATTVSFMTPEQRGRYLAILAPALQDTGKTTFY